MQKARINLALDKDLLDFLKDYAEGQRISVSDVFTQFALNLKRARENEPMQTILDDPDFCESLMRTAEDIRNGKIVWKSYDEVFS